ncbi:metapyrocatechase [Mycolicibacterium canariasense]|uniref:Metapyrocatechase n=1 Tax=Mycolicibacterium canariasense TaxID=228230 RepID=A0A100WJL5_MYCCR|nr:catechol 2,3-dioxygenase [Mycolicibacterium canariasense]MCV7207257.1 catechol 2,3-dioxygenase [Mycolicibacterium canariasense]ORV06515.1 catechol 2,3-dioxygenase [Mycolicibacterium canariasense]GAS99486.1 metapyrocatechase [Mycolicibacterium canariasense]
MKPEPIYDIAHLGHVELFTPTPDESLDFFTTTYGMYEVARNGESVYLRAWEDHDLTTLKLTASNQAGLGHVAWRASSEQALHRRVLALKEHGVEGQWIDGDIGHGAAYQFVTPSGHRTEVYYEAEKFVPSGAQIPALPNQPQKFAPHGAAVARIDHLNLLAPDVPRMREFMADTLGFKLRERLVPGGDGDEVGAWMSVMTKAHDLALTREPADTSGRLHHVAYQVQNREDVLRAADIFVENDVFIEFGPAKHSRTQGFFLYVYEPGGNRMEIFSGGIHIFAPDWEPVTWDTETGGRSTAWGLSVPPSFHSHATPVLP